MTSTYAEALETQCKLMRNVARRLDERGYAILINGLNAEARNDKYAYGYFTGSLTKFFKDWAAESKRNNPRRVGYNDQSRRPVFVHVWASVGAVADGKVFDHPFTFRCEIPNRVRYNQIHASLELMSVKRENRHHKLKSISILVAYHGSDNIEYGGAGRTQLEILLRVLEMPEHRNILLGR